MTIDKKVIPCLEELKKQLNQSLEFNIENTLLSIEKLINLSDRDQKVLTTLLQKQRDPIVDSVYKVDMEGFRDSKYTLPYLNIPMDNSGKE